MTWLRQNWQPFADAKVRLAGALAMNRQTLAAVYEQTPTDQLLPSVEPGFKERDILPLAEPDLTGARKLMQGRTVRAAVMGIFRDCDVCRREADALAAQLGVVGINVDIQEFDNPYDVAREGKIDLLDGGTNLDYLDAPAFLDTLFLHDLPSWLPSSVGPAVIRVNRLGGVQRRRQANALADRLARKDISVAAVGVAEIGGFFSPDLGCKVYPPLGYGVDLATLCLTDN